MQYFTNQLQEARLGNPKSMFIVGLCYTTGSGVVKDDSIGLAWILRARESGFEGFTSIMNIDTFYINKEGVWLNVSEAIEWYFSRAVYGDPNDLYHLGMCYYKSEDSSYSKQQAAYYFRLAAEKNQADAQYCMGVCYADGIGVPQNIYEAIRWYNFAAYYGHEGAINNLRVLQAEGYSTNA